MFCRELGPAVTAGVSGAAAATYAASDPQQPPQQAAAADVPADREWLIADKQQAMLEELLQMGVKREELVDILTELGQETSPDEALVSCTVWAMGK